MRRLFGRALLLATLFCLPAAAFAAPAPAETAVSQEIIVTGTRVPGLRAVDSPAPIQLLGAADGHSTIPTPWPTTARAMAAAKRVAATALNVGCSS